MYNLTQYPSVLVHHIYNLTQYPSGGVPKQRDIE
jgi:hypothetical protein